MPWARIEADFPTHPKVVRAGPLAGWLHVCALCWARKHLTDGFIPEETVPTLTSFGGVMVRTAEALTERPVTHEALVEKLVDLGLWEEAEGGWHIHDFLDYQPSRADIEGKSGRRRVDGRRRARTARRDDDGRFSTGVDNGGGGDRAGPVKAQVAPGHQPSPRDQNPTVDDLSPKGQGGGAGGERRASRGTVENAKGPSDTQRYLLSQLAEAESRWVYLRTGALVSLNARFGRPIVTTALQRVADDPPALNGERGAYPYLEQVCRDVQVSGQATEEVST